MAEEYIRICEDCGAPLFTTGEQAKLFKQVLTATPFKSVSLDNFPTGDPLTTLNIIGNGFDLMHGVKPSYYNFRDTLGKNNSLKFALETYLNVEDLWAHFENALAHIDSGPMLSVVDMWLDDFDAYGPDAQGTDFFAAVDTATGPVQTITDDLLWIAEI